MPAKMSQMCIKSCSSLPQGCFLFCYYQWPNKGGRSYGCFDFQPVTNWMYPPSEINRWWKLQSSMEVINYRCPFSAFGCWVNIKVFVGCGTSTELLGWSQSHNPSLGNLLVVIVGITLGMFLEIFNFPPYKGFSWKIMPSFRVQTSWIG